MPSRFIGKLSSPFSGKLINNQSLTKGYMNLRRDSTLHEIRELTSRILQNEFSHFSSAKDVELTKHLFLSDFKILHQQKISNFLFGGENLVRSLSLRDKTKPNLWSLITGLPTGIEPSK